VQRAARVLRDDGLSAAVARTAAFVYRRGVRPLLPTRPVRYADVPIARDRRLGDLRVPPTWVPGELDDLQDLPGYEETLLGALRRHVRAGDRVVVVGGGVGVTTIVAAQRAGSRGQVLCYEGGEEHVDMVHRTAQRNGVAERITVRHAVVARAIDVWGRTPDDMVVTPQALPACDVLELDCEGAEVDILRAMTIRPRVILTETHGIFGAPTEQVLALLDGLGYRSEVLGVAEPRLRAFCEEHDIRVVESVRADA
jgi:hypothetical protein